MMLPMIGSRNHKPQIVVIGGSLPSRRYSCSTSDAIRNMVAGAMNNVINR